MLTLTPRPERRLFDHLRGGKVVEILIMSDEKAIERREHGWKLHPVELGLREAWRR